MKAMTEISAKHVKTSRTFFRWPIVVVILVIIGTLYAVTAPLNIFLAREATQRGHQRLAHTMYSGAFWNALVAVLCFTGWQVMRLKTRGRLRTGAYIIAAALAIVMRVWVSSLRYELNPFPISEAILTWLPMLYAVIFAIRESKRVEVS
jgi:hypothetical protein